MLASVALASPNASPEAEGVSPEDSARRRATPRVAEAPVIVPAPTPQPAPNIRATVKSDGARPAGTAEASKTLGVAETSVPPGPALGPKARESLLASTKATGQDGLTPEERQLVRDLRARDREVRNHEEAHARVGGRYAGMPSYDLQSGPDGKRYAIGGSVPIDVSPVRGDPEATVAKMEIVKAAALAPAKPSAADRNIAALADANRLDALAELAAQRRLAPDEDTGGRGPLVAAAEALSRMARLLSDSASGFGRGMLDQAV